MKDFYFKVYDNLGNFKKTSFKEVLEVSSFSAKINGSFSDLKIKIKSNLENLEYGIGDYIKIFYGNKIHYEGFIYYRERVFNGIYTFLELSIVSKASWLCIKKYNKNFEDKIAKNILIEIVSDINNLFGENFLKIVDLNNQKLQETISLQIGEKNFLVYLQDFFKKINLKFFIDFEGNIIFSGNKHFLTFEKDISELIIGETEEFVKVIDNKIKIKVNFNYNFYLIKPPDLIKIRNLSINIDNAIVHNINYNFTDCEIELESSDSLIKLIKEIG